MRTGVVDLVAYAFFDGLPRDLLASTHIRTDQNDDPISLEGVPSCYDG